MTVNPWYGVSEGRLRWAVNSAEWDPVGGEEGDEFQFLLSLFEEDAEYEEVLNCADFAEKKQALISRLLVRRASAAVLGLRSFDSLEILRTKGRRPFLHKPRPTKTPDLGNFNFNVSYGGDWVVLASEPICVVGVDVTPPEELHFRHELEAGKEVNIFKDFLDDFTADEWSYLKGATSGGKSAFPAFQRLWSCKKAFCKARGDGRAFEFDRVAFDLKPSEHQTCEDSGPAYTATLEVDDRADDEWRMIQHELAPGYCVTVARGPTSDVVDAYGDFSWSLSRRTHEFTQEEWEAELSQVSPPFVKVPVGFLVPEDDKPEYEYLGGEVGKVTAPVHRGTKEPPLTYSKELQTEMFAPPSRSAKQAAANGTKADRENAGAFDETGAGSKARQLCEDARNVREMSKFADIVASSLGGKMPQKVMTFGRGPGALKNKPAAPSNLGRLRWALNVTEWQPRGEQHGSEFQYLLSLLPKDDRDQLLGYTSFTEQKVELLSHLLCRRACAFVLGQRSYETVGIARTERERKFLRSPRPPAPELANFNFSISHAGDWIVLASEPLCICGVEVVAPERLLKSKVDVSKDFMDQLTGPEYSYIMKDLNKGSPNHDSKPEYEAFQKIWSCKKAFLKASGKGKDFSLERAGFKLQVSEKDIGYGETVLGTVRVDNKAKPEWEFIVQRLGSDHWVAVGKGPTHDIDDSEGQFVNTLHRPTSSFSATAWRSELQRKSPRFEKIPVGCLVPEDVAQGYKRAGGTPTSLHLQPSVNATPSRSAHAGHVR